MNVVSIKYLFSEPIGVTTSHGSQPKITFYQRLVLTHINKNLLKLHWVSPFN